MKLTILFSIILLLLTLSILSGLAETKTGQAPGPADRVLFFSGGSIDDYVAYILLTTMENVELLGIVLTNADTISGPASLENIQLH